MTALFSGKIVSAQHPTGKAHVIEDHLTVGVQRFQIAVYLDAHAGKEAGAENVRRRPGFRIGRSIQREAENVFPCLSRSGYDAAAQKTAARLESLFTWDAVCEKLLTLAQDAQN